MDDRELLYEATKRGFLTEQQAQLALRTKQEISSRGLNLDMQDILLKRGLLSAAQLQEIRNQGQNRKNRFGPYTIGDKVGEGGMGVVYKCTKDGQSRELAIKIIHQAKANDEEWKKRVEREARAIIEASHPNLLKGYEIGEINGRTYVEMEYVPGRTLGDLIKEKGQLDEKVVLRVGQQIASALEQLAKMGIVHRDLKPDNIKLMPDGNAKLMDLGLAKSTDQTIPQLTMPGMTFGTPAYMSPEHCAGVKDLDVRTDIYGLGATLYHCLTGAKPFEGINHIEIIRKKLTGAVPDPRARRRGISNAAAYVIMKAMAKDRKERYQTPAEFIADLKAAEEGRMPSGAKVESAPSPAAVLSAGAESTGFWTSTGFLILVAIAIAAAAAYIFFRFLE